MSTYTEATEEMQCQGYELSTWYVNMTFFWRSSFFCRVRHSLSLIWQTKKLNEVKVRPSKRPWLIQIKSHVLDVGGMSIILEDSHLPTLTVSQSKLLYMQAGWRWWFDWIFIDFHFGVPSLCPFAKPSLPNFHLPKQNLADRGTSKIKVNKT